MEKTVIATVNYKGYKINIILDIYDTINPRVNYDNLCMMACFHRKYELGDKHDFKEPQDLLDFIEKKDVLAMPLYLYDHSGITMSTSHSYPYNDRWDACKVGYIYATYDMIKKEYGVKRISQKLKEQVYKIMIGEVTDYDHYIRGNVYGYEIAGLEQSCWGFLGEPDDSGIIDDAKSHIDWHLKELRKKHAKKLRGYIKNKVPIHYRKPMVTK